MSSKLKSRVKYYVVFTDEVDGLVEGQAGLMSEDLTVKQAEKIAKDYLKEDDSLSGVIMTFHDIKMYEAKLGIEAEIESRLIER